MRVEVLLKDTRKILKKSSNLLRQLEHNPTSHTLDILSKEIVTGELLEHELLYVRRKGFLQISSGSSVIKPHSISGDAATICRNMIQVIPTGKPTSHTHGSSVSSYPSYLTQHTFNPT